MITKHSNCAIIISLMLASASVNRYGANAQALRGAVSKQPQQSQGDLSLDFNPLPPPPALTPPPKVCGERNARCESSDDCCSRRCNFLTNECAPKPPSGLSSSTGGDGIRARLGDSEGGGGSRTRLGNNSESGFRLSSSARPRNSVIP